MKKKITEISPLLFDDYLVFALSKKWIDVFGKIPKFQVFVSEEGQLHIIGPKLAKKEERWNE